MGRKTRILLTIASLMLIVSYFVPIWKVLLDAPQYPEGLGLQIWLHTITGDNPNDLNKINNLNHYIGMKVIEPDAIAELKLMPYLIGLMILSGLLIAWRGGRRWLYLWVALFILLGIAGMTDFYLWEYDYGHNLDMENAIIKVPGMNYQPPLIGSKKLLNFTAFSFPALGGWIIAGSVLLGMAGAYLEWKNIPQTEVVEK